MSATTLTLVATFSGCAARSTDQDVQRQDLVAASAAVVCDQEAIHAFPDDIRGLCTAQALANGANHMRTLLRLVELKQLQFDGRAASQCLRDLREDPAAPLPPWLTRMPMTPREDAYARRAPLASCAAVFQGDFAVGARCDDDEQCATGVCAGLERRTCQTPVASDLACGAGQVCAADTVCEEGRCVACAASATGGGDCEPPRVAGGRCRAPSDCQSPLNCVDGVCAAGVPSIGEPCGRSELWIGATRFAVKACTGDSFCSENHTCQAAAREGERCAAMGECADGLYCNITCHRPTQDVGQFCEFETNRRCVSGTFCGPTRACWPESFRPSIPGLMSVSAPYASDDGELTVEVRVEATARGTSDGVARLYSPFRNRFADTIARLLPESVVANWCGPTCAPGSCQPDMQCGAPRVGDACEGESVAKTEFALFGCVDGEWHTVGASTAL